MKLSPENNHDDAATHLKALRDELKRRRLDGFIVAHADRYQAEYIAGHDQRLAWLTCFTGSAGLAVVLEDRAAIFVDGRYSLQAAGEVDRELFDICHLVDQPPGRWIIDNIKAAGRIGFDPWLLTPEQASRYRSACERAGAELVPFDNNPVDAVWADQPPPPMAPVVTHDIAFSGRPHAEKRADITAVLGREKQDCVVISGLDSIAWLLNIRGGDVAYSPLVHAICILYADSSVELFIEQRKLGPGLRRHLGEEVAILPPDALAEVLKRLGKQGKRVRLCPAQEACIIFDRLADAGADVVRAADPCTIAKAVKTAAELAGIRAAHRRDGAALAGFLAWLANNAAKGEVSEISAAERLEEFRRGNEHFRGLSFATISAAGANGAIVHYQVSNARNRNLLRGSLYLVDSGAQYQDGTTDVTRTVAVGVPNQEMRQNFTRVLKGHIALATAKFPKGTTGSQLDCLARGALWEVGLDYDHGTGHGVGCYLNVHEGPQRISKRTGGAALKAGMVISNEPGYYKAGEYGIRIENLMAVEQVNADGKFLGFETLTLVPIDLALVDGELLDGKERAWLNDYHARVCEEISPLVDAATGAWLKTATHGL